MSNTRPTLAQISGAGTAAALNSGTGGGDLPTNDELPTYGTAAVLDTGTGAGELPTNGDLPAFGTAAVLDTGTGAGDLPTNADLPLTRAYDSGNQTITTGDLLTLAHGLGARPKLVQHYLVCTDAGGEAGYAQGDEIVAPMNDSGVAGEHGASISLTATSILVRFSAAGSVFEVLNGTTGVGAVLTNTKWAFGVRAFA